MTYLDYFNIQNAQALLGQDVASRMNAGVGINTPIPILAMNPPESLSNRLQSKWTGLKTKATDAYNSGNIAKADRLATRASNTVNGTNGVNGMSSGLQSGLSSAGSLLGGMSGSKLTGDQMAMREGVRSAIGKMGPIGAIISAATGVVDMVGDVTGLNLDNMDTSAAKRANIKGAGVNNLMNALPGNSMIWGAFMGKTKKADQATEEVNQLRNAYSGTAADIDASGELGGKRFLFGKKKANKFIEQQNQRNKLVTNIGMTNNLRKQSSGEYLASQNQRRYSGNTGLSSISLASKGMKFPELEEAKKLLAKREEVQKFAEGGKMNVIAEGALHSRKNHLDETEPGIVDVDLSDVTKKGIPVVSLDDGGEILQHAEIESGELIFTKELTDKIESLYKNGSEEAMIEAGKLLSEELIENTDDKTNKILVDDGLDNK